MTNSPPDDSRLVRLAAICLALPEAARQDSGQHVQFLVRGKKFAYFLADHHGDGIVAVCCRAAPGENEARVAADPGRFYLPAYIGARGWVGLRLDLGAIDWAEVAEMVAYSYRLVAPKRLAALLTAPSAGGPAFETA